MAYFPEVKKELAATPEKSREKHIWWGGDRDKAMGKKKKKKRNAYYDNDGLKMEQKLNSKDKRLKKNNR